MTNPTPEEARAALRQAGDQQAAARRGAQPRWALAATAVLMIALGVAADLNNALQPLTNWVIAAFVLVLTAASRSKRLGAAFGYQRVPDPAGFRGARAALLAVAAVLVLLLGTGLRTAQVPFTTTICMVLLAVLMFGWEPLLSWMRRRTHG